MTTTMTERRLGVTGPTTSALGIGTWALGGPWTFNGQDAGWGDVDDDVSARAIHAAIDAGVRLIDTADCYGAGHSERVVGRALAGLAPGVRADVLVATKFGNLTDEVTRSGGGTDVTPRGIRRACEASLRRLGVEAIDVYQLHDGVGDGVHAAAVVATLDELVDAGLIRGYGTSVDAVDVVDAFAASAHSRSVQTQVNVFGHSSAVLAAARRSGLAVLARSPLAMGLLTGKYDRAHRPPAGDVRRDTPWWTYFDDDAMDTWLGRLDAIRELLTSGGRTLTQGCIAYLWGLDASIVPLPGVRTPEQAVENAAALHHGPLPASTVREIDHLLADSPERT